MGQLVGKRPGEKRKMKILKGVSGALQPVREPSDLQCTPVLVLVIPFAACAIYFDQHTC